MGVRWKELGNVDYVLAVEPTEYVGGEGVREITYLLGFQHFPKRGKWVEAWTVTYIQTR